MRSYYRPILVRGFTLAALMVLTGALTACGQSGPLYMPDNPPENQKPRSQRNTPPAATPAPAPATAP